MPWRPCALEAISHGEGGKLHSAPGTSHALMMKVTNTGKSSAPPSGALRSTLESFIEHMERGEITEAAKLWHLPALILGDEQVHGPLSHEHLTRWLSDAVAAAPHPRIGRAAVHVRTIEWLSERVAQVATSWPELRSGGALEGIESTRFVVRIDEHLQPRIRALFLVAPGMPVESGR